MKPVSFPQQNTVFAKDQPEYLPLPAHRDGFHKDDPSIAVTTCWALTWRERLTVLIRGRLWLQQLTFNNPLQPVKLYVKCPLP